MPHVTISLQDRVLVILKICKICTMINLNQKLECIRGIVLWSMFACLVKFEVLLCAVGSAEVRDAGPPKGVHQK